MKNIKKFINNYIPNIFTNKKYYQVKDIEIKDEKISLWLKGKNHTLKVAKRKINNDIIDLYISSASNFNKIKFFKDNKRNAIIIKMIKNNNGQRSSKCIRFKYNNEQIIIIDNIEYSIDQIPNI